ncbi:Uncharacterized protein APZ42_025104 [Daphnia magna]|uniref:Uncharacterized protein n=1 Tax=Daphnia magna TaxID=35525 RepID=A0A164TGU1_9CRUS|nr:Uncharacterized protein APZ42_025104 [Daphnia magna]
MILSEMNPPPKCKKNITFLHVIVNLIEFRLKLTRRKRRNFDFHYRTFCQ